LRAGLGRDPSDATIVLLKSGCNDLIDPRYAIQVVLLRYLKGMNWRDVQDADLLDALSIDDTHAGFELVGSTKAVAVWKALLRSPAFHGVVIEASPPMGGHRIVGFGASVFVSADFVDAELSNPRPGLNARLIQRVDAGEPLILDLEAIRRGNTHGGLDTVVVYTSWRDSMLKLDALRDLQMLMATAFVEKHIGYRCNRILYEATSEADGVFARETHVYRFVSRFDDFHAQNPGNPWNRDRSLVVSTRTEALAVPGSAMAMLFHYQEPKLRLHEADQELLSAALTGLTDQELSRKLNLKLGAVKKRWLSLFGRIADTQPDLLPSLYGDNGDSKRGPQKRHHVLAYVRNHPEELRPIQVQRRAGARWSGLSASE